MLELIAISVLSFCFIKSCIGEKQQEEIEEEKKRIRDLKIKVFCYAVRNGMLYDDVVKKLQDRKITIDQL